MNMFAALADPTRRKIMEMLAQRGRLSASEISQTFPVSPPAISQHLKVLREANLVQMEKKGQQRIYRINAETLLELEDWAGQMARLWSERFDALEKVLEAEKMKNSNQAVERNKSMSAEAKKELVLTRVFDAPRELVFKAWTDPKLVAQWWSPRMFTNPVSELDVRPGGAILIHMLGPDGATYPMTGVYHEVVVPERLVFTSRAVMDDDGKPQLEVLNTATFEDMGGKTRVTLQAVVVRAAPGAAFALSGMEEGWNQSLDKLAELLAGL